MSMNEIVAMADQQTDHPEENKDVEKAFQHRRSDHYLAQERETRNANYSDARNYDVLTFAIGQQVDLDTLLGEHLRSVINTDRRSARRKKWLRRDGQSL